LSHIKFSKTNAKIGLKVKCQGHISQNKVASISDQ